MKWCQLGQLFGGLLIDTKKAKPAKFQDVAATVIFAAFVAVMFYGAGAFSEWIP